MDGVSIDNLVVSSQKVVLATCNLNQWALDFDGNLARTLKSIEQAKAAGARYRLGPELELSGYSCEDHFLEMDTYMHCEQSLAAILSGDATKDILVDIGCPVLHNHVRYNCRVFCYNQKIVLIRPKIFLADDGNYREKRFFASWDVNDTKVHEHPLPDLLRKVTGQVIVPFGISVIATEETTLASEICEELWAPRSPHSELYLSGVEIITNGSGSHHALRKLDSRLNLIKNATRKCGGIYVFANMRGCDGNRLYFDGCSLICCNGDLLAQASQFSLKDVEVITAVVDLESVRSFRGATASLQEQSSGSDITNKYSLIDLRHFSLRSMGSKQVTVDLSTHIPDTHIVQSRIHTPEEECCKGPACWLWDYLRRSKANGFLLPLSGGADSSSVAAIVRVMCEMVAAEALEGNDQVLVDLKRVYTSNQIRSAHLPSLNNDDHAGSVTDLNATDQAAQLANEIANQLLHTVYMGTSHSSRLTQDRAQRLAEAVHSYHNTLFIDEIVATMLKVFSLISGRVPRFTVQGGTMGEDLALQNIQARIRMVMAYLCAQLFPWLRGNAGFLLVLGSANVDEALRGYMTKYDCSSADINPIGGMCKGDLKKMLEYVASTYKLPVLNEIAAAPPTAELRPIQDGGSDWAGGGRGEHTQLDEEEMGMTYDELGVFGKLRKIYHCGPVKMFVKLLEVWKHITPSEVAEKVSRLPYMHVVLLTMCCYITYSFFKYICHEYVGQAFLPLLCHQSTQTHHPHSCLPCRVLLA
ncbi:hypothetical protein EON65_11370 [archaeon]|nr:MAG: hypothetical protein EON65_11370 [archaeon]